MTKFNFGICSKVPITVYNNLIRITHSFDNALVSLKRLETNIFFRFEISFI